MNPVPMRIFRLPRLRNCALGGFFDGRARIRAFAAALTVCFFAFCIASVASAGLPADHGVDKYSSIWKRSPFVVVMNAGPAEGIAGRFAVTGFAKLGASDIVFVFDRKELKRFAIAQEAPVDGVELVSVADGGRPEDFKARIRTGGESAEIQFDASLAANPEPPAEKRPLAGMQRVSAPGGQPAAAVSAIPQGAQTVLAGSDQAPVPRPTRVIRRRTISAQ